MSFEFKDIKDKKIWIYGIGIIGKRLCELFELVGVGIQGILVSDAKKNPKSYSGIKVREMASGAVDKDAYIIVAISGEKGNQVGDSLKARGYENVLQWNAELLMGFWKAYPHTFINRKHNKKKVLFILAGYKEILWPCVFGRVERFLPDDTEVCICSSGVYEKKLDDLAEKNDWSYLYTDVNSVTIIQNIAYSVYEEYQWIYKMDEDIFLTENALEGLSESYERANEKLPFHVGMVVPLIPINEACSILVLKKYGCLEDFESKFGEICIEDTSLIYSRETAAYMWGKDSDIPCIDQVMRDCRTDDTLSCIGTRYNIGLIFFSRTLWELMNGFSASGAPDMGADEVEFGSFCHNLSHPVVLTHSVAVGHFSFGPQWNEMKEYFEECPERFSIG